jgi:hypothetical protein
MHCYAVMVTVYTISAKIWNITPAWLSFSAKLEIHRRKRK